MKKFSSFLQRYPFHWFILSVYPILALLAVNIEEVDPRVALRPLVVGILLGAVLWLVFSLIFRDARKGAVATSFVLLLFYSYGHLYEYLQQTPLLGFSLGRHRILAPLYVSILILGLGFIALKLRRLGQATQTFNVVALFLVLLPSIQIISFNRQISIGEQASQQIFTSAEPLSVEDPSQLPDVYYIVLDTYARADAMQEDFDFDNTPFLEELRRLGFYVADCSRSNYTYTQGSMTATLNMDYLPVLSNYLAASGTEDQDIWLLLKNSLVRSQLESIGYKTVAFETGFEWSRIADADYYLGLVRDPLSLQSLDPFEAMLIKSTAGLILTDSQVKSFSDQAQELQERINEVNFPYSDFAERQLFILNQMLEVPSLPGPKFVFVHLLIPHVPYVFDSEGNILEDPGFYSNKAATPINKEYLREGYTGEVEFINKRMLEILGNILAESDEEPIIVLMGDHGFSRENRLDILNTYYLPGEGKEDLYPSISPINSFRVILNRYFGTNYPLLPDEGFILDQEMPVPENSPNCLP